MGKRNLLAEYKRRPGSLILRILVYLAAALTLVCIAFILIYILAKGIPNLTPDLFKLEYTSDNCSMLPALVNTLFMTLLSLLIAGPIGIFAAIYLVEYAKSGNKLVGIVRITAETLTGIPSIVYGLFGMILFMTKLGWGLSLLSGAFTLAIMVLPVIMRTTEEALLAVPKSYREGSFGLGAGKLRTVFKVVLPSAVPGILSGVILATGRIVGGDSSVDLYGRQCAENSEEFIFFHTNLVRTYVSSFQRGTSYGSGICNSRCSSCIRSID